MATRNDDLDLGRWTDAKLAQLEERESRQVDAARAFARFRQRSQRHTHRTTRWAVAATLVAMTGAGVMAFPPAHALAERCIAACVDQSHRLGTWLWDDRPSASSDHAGAMLPKATRSAAPDFSLVDRSGHSVSISAHRGEVVLLNFWATWCSPCKREVPWLVEFQSKYKDRGFTVLGLSLDTDGWTSVAQYIDDARINYPVALATDEVTALYGGVGAVPMTLVIDREGRVAALHLGLLNKDEIEAEIVKVLEK